VDVCLNTKTRSSGGDLGIESGLGHLAQMAPRRVSWLKQAESSRWKLEA
jgi:hypothetical protein